jgi:hypothetical protein
MAKVQVPAHWVGQSYLPAICARHGGPPTSFRQAKFYTRAPLWTYALIPLGLLVFAIVTLTMRTTVPSRLPACGRCSADRRRFIAGVISLWVATVAIIVLGVQLSSDALVILGFFAIIFDLIACFTGDYFRVRGHVTQDLAWVNLRGVDDAFAAAISNALRPAPPVPAPTASTPIGSPAPTAAYYGTQNILPGQ